MGTLVMLQGPEKGKEFAIGSEPVVLGRETNNTIRLPSKVVSRHHAKITCVDGAYFVEDLGSSNGTYVNEKPVKGRQLLRENDQVRIGEFVFSVLDSQPVTESDQSIRESVDMLRTNSNLFAHNPAHQLQVVLDITQHLSQTLEVDPLMSKLVEYLLVLFPQADRGMVLLCQGDHLIVRAQRSRRGDTDFPYSRTIVKQALADSKGLLSDDVGADMRFARSATIGKLDIRSVLCVPMIGLKDKRLGVIQLDRTQGATSFRKEDLHLLATVAMQVAAVLENVSLHELRVQEARIRKELALAREIQKGFLPTNFEPVPGGRYEFYARVQPALEVAGDLYDVFALPDGRLAFFLGDVSGKGMPASLFMVAVRVLCRHLAGEGLSPARTLTTLNEALSEDNPSGMFVTLIHGIYNPITGDLVLSVAGHPMPLLRRADGRVDELELQSGSILGYSGTEIGLVDTPVQLQPGETLLIYTDGFNEAFSKDGETMYGTDRLREAFGGERLSLSLKQCAEELCKSVIDFTGGGDLQDDMTLLLLRRVSGSLLAPGPAPLPGTFQDDDDQTFLGPMRQ